MACPAGETSGDNTGAELEDGDTAFFEGSIAKAGEPFIGVGSTLDGAAALGPGLASTGDGETATTASGDGDTGGVAEGAILADGGWAIAGNGGVLGDGGTDALGATRFGGGPAGLGGLAGLDGVSVCGDGGVCCCASTGGLGGWVVGAGVLTTVDVTVGA
jgi:hypothetical protein